MIQRQWEKESTSGYRFCVYFKGNNIICSHECTVLDTTEPDAVRHTIKVLAVPKISLTLRVSTVLGYCAPRGTWFLLWPTIEPTG
jgi:hypothetical protein